LHQLGAKVVFGDIATDAAQSLLSSMGAPADVTFIEGDLGTYNGNYNLVKAAFDKYGKIDHAIANAALFEYTNEPWIDAKLTVDNVGDESLVREHQKLFDLNVYGLCVFVRAAAVFLRENRKASEDKTITLFGSVCNLRDSPGAYVYQVRLKQIPR
jgi:NAD(P)-dependent dehydrogenase (short-subunit alcohol dehydrogenase family)